MGGGEAGEGRHGQAREGRGGHQRGEQRPGLRQQGSGLGGHPGHGVFHPSKTCKSCPVHAHDPKVRDPVSEASAGRP